MHIMARLQVNQLKNNKKKTREKAWPMRSKKDNVGNDLNNSVYIYTQVLKSFIKTDKWSTFLISIHQTDLKQISVRFIRIKNYYTALYEASGNFT